MAAGRVPRAARDGSIESCSTSARAAAGAVRSKASHPARKRSPTASPSARYDSAVGRASRSSRSRSGHQGQLQSARRRPVLRPRHRVEPGGRIQDPIECCDRDPRLVLRSFPGDELGRQVRHQDRDALAIRSRPEIGGDERFDEVQAAVGDEPFAQRDVVRRPDDPVHRRRRSLEDEALPSTLQDGQGRAGPAVVGKRRLGDPGEPVGREQLAERVRASGPQQGAGTSSAPSGPPSR